MKKRDLVQRLKDLAKQAGFSLILVGGTKHDKYQLNGTVILVPRHREINEITASEIIKQAKRAIERSGDNDN